MGHGGEPATFSKNHRHFTRFGVLAREVRRAVRGRRAVLDGEIVCINDEGRADFAALMTRRGTPVYAAFDLLGLDGEDLRELPLIERKRRLAILLRQSRTVRYVSHVRGSGRELMGCRQRATRSPPTTVARRLYAALWRSGLRLDGVSTERAQRLKNQQVAVLRHVGSLADTGTAIP